MGVRLGWRGGEGIREKGEKAIVQGPGVALPFAHSAALNVLSGWPHCAKRNVAGRDLIRAIPGPKSERAMRAPTVTADGGDVQIGSRADL